MPTFQLLEYSPRSERHVDHTAGGLALRGEEPQAVDRRLVRSDALRHDRRDAAEPVVIEVRAQTEIVVRHRYSDTRVFPRPWGRKKGIPVGQAR